MTPLFARQQSPDRVFERLYRSHVQDVYRYALMVLRNRQDAEDVVQTTFLKAYRVFARGERPRNPRPWLITIAHNTCRTRLRDAMRRPQEVAFDERVAETVESQPRDGVEPKELLRALGALSFNQRSALVMRELEGRSYSEIAKVLRVSPSAVETLLFRARRAVREQLEGALTCGEAERSLSLDLDGRLTKQGKSQLRAHLRTCDECSSLARRQRARRAALRGFGPVPLPGSLASWGGGTAAGTGLAAKVAAVVAAGAAAVGVGYQAAEAVSEGVPAGVASPANAATPSAAGAVQFSAFGLVAATSPSNVRLASRTSWLRLPHEGAEATLLAGSGVPLSPAFAPAWLPSSPQTASSAFDAFAATTVGAIGVPVAAPATPAVTTVPSVQPPPLPVPAPQPPLQPPPLQPPTLPAAPAVPAPAPQLTVPAPQLPAPSPPQLPPPPTISVPVVPLPTVPVDPPALPPPPIVTLPAPPVDELLP
jgi:RNA polymerase sigma factor (sigma-70 family)